jgi:hypothetical protein
MCRDAPRVRNHPDNDQHSTPRSTKSCELSAASLTRLIGTGSGRSTCAKFCSLHPPKTALTASRSAASPQMRIFYLYVIEVPNRGISDSRSYSSGLNHHPHHWKSVLLSVISLEHSRLLLFSCTLPSSVTTPSPPLASQFPIQLVSVSSRKRHAFPHISPRTRGVNIGDHVSAVPEASSWPHSRQKNKRFELN